jgi:integrase
VDLGPLATKLVWPGAKDSDLIWPNENYFGLQKKFRRLAKKASIEFRRFGFHTLRRTYASWRDELGLSGRPDENLVRDVSHSNTAMNEHYIQKAKTRYCREASKFGVFLGTAQAYP